ncbi:phosphopantetheine-binding protein [Cytobacillus oceanisediminis]|uniref:phosphopantetheine-binding protein n=1 Tax=Cytobacillus oceanisediminis TaxID=665099 RepID=UPI001C2126F2|nr:phosphopantetheine-binding protein [Cytobacillus oceanisediminis]MBU8772063.1 hypothetical protein [Cytobacillus oceanisediminis]
MYEEMIIDTVKKISGIENISMETQFSSLEMDSVSVLEALIELEIMLNIDVLDEDLEFNNLVIVRDLYDYIAKIIEVQ